MFTTTTNTNVITSASQLRYKQTCYTRTMPEVLRKSFGSRHSDHLSDVIKYTVLHYGIITRTRIFARLFNTFSNPFYFRNTQPQFCLSFILTWKHNGCTRSRTATSFEQPKKEWPTKMAIDQVCECVYIIIMIYPLSEGPTTFDGSERRFFRKIRLSRDDLPNILSYAFCTHIPLAACGCHSVEQHRCYMVGYNTSAIIFHSTQR